LQAAIKVKEVELYERSKLGIYPRGTSKKTAAEIVNSMYCIEVDKRYAGATNPGLTCTCKSWGRVSLCSHILFVGTMLSMCPDPSQLLKKVTENAKGGRKKKVRKGLQKQPDSPNAKGGKGKYHRRQNNTKKAIEKRKYKLFSNMRR
jgi:hypothetical protein